ncbi:MAG: hypothetical protein HZA17_10325 [Nitrospirae bacterium]|nr:hypothetical protein [Nitrospirota bacterium]
MKNVSRLCCVSIIILLAACAAKKVEMPSYEGRDFRDVLSERKAISEIETTFSISFERNESEIRGDGALHISSSGDMSLRVYSLGFLAMEMTSRDGTVKSTPRLDRNKTLILTQGLRDCLFWWDMEGLQIQEDADDYLLRNLTREVWVDKKTFLPKKQKIYFDEGGELTIYYDFPVREDNIWYQSKIRIELSKYAVTLHLRNMSFKI